MPLTSNTPPPEGFRWTSLPAFEDEGGMTSPGFLVLDGHNPVMSVEDIQNIFITLRDWMTTWECETDVYSTQSTTPRAFVVAWGGVVRTVRIDPEFAVWPSGTNPRPSEYGDLWPNIVCRYGTNHGRAGTSLLCQCGESEELLLCVCNSPNSHLLPTSRLTWMGERYRYHCDRSLRRCQREGCPDSVLRESPHSFCEMHRGEEEECSSCGGEVCFGETGEYNVRTNSVLCYNCMDRICPQCFRLDQDLDYFQDDLDIYICATCYEQLNTDRYEIFDDSPFSNDLLLLEANEHRPIRTCSIELETVNGGPVLASALAAEGLSISPHMQEYHASLPDAFCHVERDSSIGEGGGEVVFNRLRLDDFHEAERLAQSLTIMRRLVTEGHINIGLSCGTHVHIDAHQFGIGDTRNVVVVTNYLEDPIYRLSAAHYTRHRGTRHAIPLPKGPFTDRRQFGLMFFNTNEHHSALNVSNYWAAMRQNCRCGASVIGEHDKCDCNLGKCTFEFRFFNGTSNPRKLHAYVALCQSIVAYAKTVDDLDADQFEAMDYFGADEEPAGGLVLEAWEERLRWMLQNLYFSESEKQSLLYTTTNSKLNELGETRLEEIFRTTYVAPNAPSQVIEHKNPRGVRLDRRTGSPYLDEAARFVNEPPPRTMSGRLAQEEAGRIWAETHRTAQIRGARISGDWIVEESSDEQDSEEF